MRDKILIVLMLVTVPTMSGIVLAQTEQQNRTLIVNGQPGQATVVQINGRSYVDLATLARIANGSLGFRGNQIVLTLPASQESVPAAGSATSQTATPGFSRDFMAAGIEEMSVIREWRSALANALQNGYPVTENWVAGYRGRAADSLRLASLAVSTDSDRSAFQLLTNEFNNMDKWNRKILQARKDMDAAKYMGPNGLDDDPLYQKILSCAHALASMSASGQFEDDASCH